jgi:CheY-like chemotaxis protein
MGEGQNSGLVGVRDGFMVARFMKARVSTLTGAEKRHGTSKQQAIKRRRIRTVIVDDSLLVVRSLELFLRRQEGFEVVGTAANGEQAVQRVADLRPDLVLMDVRMPAMDGLEATRRIKEKEAWPLVILFTLEDSEQVRAAAKVAGSDGFASKGPKMLEGLWAAIAGAFPKVKVRQWK